jgi:hypothetical protein
MINLTPTTCIIHAIPCSWYTELGHIILLWIFMHSFSFNPCEGGYKSQFFHSQIELAFGIFLMIIWQALTYRKYVVSLGKKQKSRWEKMNSYQAEGNQLLRILCQLLFSFKSKSNTTILDWQTLNHLAMRL